MTEQLEKKVAQAIRLLKATAPKDGSPVEVAYSGGKDSDVILQLVKESGIPYRAIYKNTTIDPPGTIKHVREMGVEVHPPKNGMSFFKLIEKKGYPSRFVRFCCDELKEYKILDNQVVGVRKCESKAREERYDEPTICRIYNGKKSDHVNQILPILEWTDEDVREFIEARGIKCAPVYYDEQGCFHVERRLGCIGCPLANKTQRTKEFRQYPGILRQWIRSGKKYLDSHPQVKASENFADVYEWFYFCMFDKDGLAEHKQKVQNGLFGRPDFKAFLEEYFKVNLENL